LDAYRLAKQNNLLVGMYHDLMIDNVDELTNKRIKALKSNEKEKLECPGPITRMLKASHSKLEI
jgi:hypothetical protein